MGAGVPPVLAAPAPPAAGPLDDMYRRWTLDLFVDLAYAVAQDYPKRPQHYRDVGAQAATLANFRFRYGADPLWPNADQRQVTFANIFGPSDGKVGGDRSGKFQSAAAALRNAAAAFSNRPPDVGAAVKREAFRAAANSLASYLNSVAGRASFVQAIAETAPIFGQAQNIFTDLDVAWAFGLAPGPGGAPVPWPLGAPANPSQDADGSALMEEVSRRLKSPTLPEIAQQRFLVVQRIAHYGALTISCLQNNWHAPNPNPADIDALIGYAYNWATAMQEVGT